MQFNVTQVRNTHLILTVYRKMNSSGASGGGTKGGRSWQTPPDDVLVVADPMTGKKVGREIRISPSPMLIADIYPDIEESGKNISKCL